VHHAVVVVLAGGVGFSFGELGLPAGLDVVPVHSYMRIAIRTLLLMSHTQRMTQLMNRDTDSVAAIRGQVDGVRTPSLSRR